MRMVLVGVAALLLGACTMTSYTETEDEIRIHFGLGGEWEASKKLYRDFDATGKMIVLDGVAFSSDGFLALSIPGSCYTENAELRLHMARYLGIWPAREATEEATHYLPKPIRERFRRDAASWLPVGFLSIDYEELLELWPEGECKRAALALFTEGETK